MRDLSEIRNINNNTETYRIVRFFRDGSPKEVIVTGLALDDAQAHCNDKSTAEPDWFDGYEVEA
jgi:hypothetical protein